MSKKVVNKKIIVTVNFRNMTEAELTTAFTKKQTAAGNAPAGLTLNPTAAAVLTQIGSRGTLLNTKANLEAQLKSNTQNIHDADRALKDVFVDDWATQIQNFPNITVAQVQAMAFGVKGIDSGHAATAVEDTARNAASAPVIIKIDADVHGQHTLHTRNNLTGKIGHPKDVSRIDMYGQTGGTQPADLAALIANGGG